MKQFLDAFEDSLRQINDKERLGQLDLAPDVPPVTMKDVVSSILNKFAALARPFASFQIFLILQRFNVRSFPPALVADLKSLKEFLEQVGDCFSKKKKTRPL